MVYEKKSYAAGSMCDTEVKLSPIAADHLIEDSVTELMGSLHIDGVTAMKKYGAMWVFSKNLIRIRRRPDWLEGFTVRSYISGHSALRLFVDTEVCSENGEQLIASRIELCALDLETGKIRKPSTLGFTEDMEHAEPLESLAFSRFGKGGGEVIERVEVRSTNLDYCSHTNNVEYLRFILNTYTAEELTRFKEMEIELHYQGQSFEGDELSIEKLTAEDSELFFIRRQDSSAAVTCAVRGRRE